MSKEQANGWQEDKSWTNFCHVFHKITARFQVKKVIILIKAFCRVHIPSMVQPTLDKKHLTKRLKSQHHFPGDWLLGGWNMLKKQHHSKQKPQKTQKPASLKSLKRLKSQHHSKAEWPCLFSASFLFHVQRGPRACLLFGIPLFY